MAKVFGHAPVVHAVALASFATTWIREERAQQAHFTLGRLLGGDYKALVTPFVTFESRSQLAVGCVLLYILSTFERQFGTRKFGAFAFFSWVLAILLQLGLSTVTDSAGVKSIVPANGPFFLIFACMVHYYKFVPAVSPSQFAFLGMTISEKTWAYLLAAQLAGSDGLRSVYPAVMGLFLGVFYSSNQMGIQKWRLPGPLEKLISLPFALFGEPSLGAQEPNNGAQDQPAPSRTTRSAARAAAAAAESSPREAADGGNDDEDDDASPRGERQPSWSEATHARLHDFGGLGDAIQPPTEEEIGTITALGFDRAKAIHALEQCDNNVQQAANFLLR